jgi:hypothetical protein
MGSLDCAEAQSREPDRKKASAIRQRQNIFFMRPSPFPFFRFLKSYLPSPLGGGVVIVKKSRHSGEPRIESGAGAGIQWQFYGFPTRLL